MPDSTKSPTTCNTIQTVRVACNHGLKSRCHAENAVRRERGQFPTFLRISAALAAAQVSIRSCGEWSSPIESQHL